MSRRDRTAEAFVRSLFEHHGRSMLAYAERLTGDRATAEGVVEEALLLAWRQAEHLAVVVERRGWLLAVVRGVARGLAHRPRAPRPPEPTVRTDLRSDRLQSATR